MRTTLIVTAAFVLWAAAIGHAAAAETTDAAIKLFQFQPKELAVKAGTIVKWTNGDDIEHSITAGDPGKESGAFDSGLFAKGGSFAFTFSKPGTYSYFCRRHNSMKGRVTVAE